MCFHTSFIIHINWRQQNPHAHSLLLEETPLDGSLGHLFLFKSLAISLKTSALHSATFKGIVYVKFLILQRIHGEKKNTSFVRRQFSSRKGLNRGRRSLLSEDVTLSCSPRNRTNLRVQSCSEESRMKQVKKNRNCSL